VTCRRADAGSDRRDELSARNQDGGSMIWFADGA
jgi:hypothetical protein